MKIPSFMEPIPNGSPCVMGNYKDVLFPNAYYVIYWESDPIGFIAHIHGGKPPEDNTSQQFEDPDKARQWIIDALIRMGNTDVLLMSVALGLK